MATVVFLQRDPIEWLGLMYLSATLKANGHRTRMVVDALEPGGAVESALREPADLFAFSPLVTDFRWVLGQAAALKARRNVPVVLGGTHATLNPEEMLAHPEVDVVCRGEGEAPLLELAEAVDEGRDWGGIANLWSRRDGVVVRNELRDLVSDLDTLPLPDRELYAGYPALRALGKRPLHMGRGCPYGCSYCHNARKRELYHGKGSYLRWRSIDGVLAEVEQLARGSFFKVLHFVDDGFGLREDWLVEFLPRLGRLLDPRPAVFANMRADMVTEGLCAAFRDYGAERFRLRIAVECGDERYRREVLRKTISDADLRRAARLLHASGVRFATYNMMGLPGETLGQAIETLRLNVELRPAHAFCFLYQPFPGTDLARFAVDCGTVDAATLAGGGAGSENFLGTFESHSPLCQDNVVELENLQRLFALVVKVPLLLPLATRAVRFRRLAPVLRLFYQASQRLFVFFRRRVDAY
jgi:anaerobic magnesium-protoporphyrin IX monomethyl ester cyclase